MDFPDPYNNPKYYSTIDVHGKFHDEHIAFSQARVYISDAGTLARKGIEPLAQTHSDFSGTLQSRGLTPEIYIVAQLFIAHISAFELFLQEMITVVVRRYPQKIGSFQLRLSEMLEASDTEELIFRAADETLHKLTYKKPSEYLKDVCDLLSVEISTISSEWPVFIEAKARRDLGVHNGWICNHTYLRKLSESQIATDLKIGELSIPRDFRYLNTVSDSLYKIAKLLYGEVSKKLKV